MQWNRDGVRHVAMRLGLGFVMGWFGLQELRSPSEWAVFVPAFVSDASPVAVNDLVVLHGFLLVLAAASVVLGLFYLPGALLGVGLVVEIVFGLWYDSGFNDLVVRDLGLLGLAAALAADGTRFWHLDEVLARQRLAARSSRRRSEREGSAAPGQHWAARAGAAGALIGVVALLGVALNATGGSGSALPGAAAALSQPSNPSPTAAPAGTAAGTPTPAPSIKFDGWRYQKWSYEVYPGAISADARKALAGFDVSIQDEGDADHPDGAEQPLQGRPIHGGEGRYRVFRGDDYARRPERPGEQSQGRRGDRGERGWVHPGVLRSLGNWQGSTPGVEVGRGSGTV